MTALNQEHLIVFPNGATSRRFLWKLRGQRNESCPQPRTIREFVSSTFTDLKHERDTLQRDMFPKLEQLCATRQFQFQAIDLPWGTRGISDLRLRISDW